MTSSVCRYCSFVLRFPAEFAEFIVREITEYGNPGTGRLADTGGGK